MWILNTFQTICFYSEYQDKENTIYNPEIPSSRITKYDGS